MRRLLYIFILLANLQAAAQQLPTVYNTRKLVTALDSFRNKLPVEKLYLQLDKTYYSPGDTLRFKSYLLNADFLTPSTRSGLLYVELDDAAGQMVKRVMVPVIAGTSWGNIALNEEQGIADGGYTLRAYTSWMRNFGEDYIFKKAIYISALSGSTLIKSGFKLQNGADKDKIEASLSFTNLDKDALRLKDMQLRVMNGRRTLIRDKAVTGMDGTLNINFDLADKTAINNLAIKAKQTGKGADTTTLTIPVIINRVENTDLQFMPEGGNLIAGIKTRVGFKAIGEDGKSVHISGKVFNSKQQEVAVFTATHAGMGSFEFTPQPNDTYSAKLTVPNGTDKNYPLPTVSIKGTTLKITPKGSDSLEITLTATPDLINAPAYHLMAEARGILCYAASAGFKQATLKRTIATSLFPSGIAHFTLLNSVNQPVNERVVYIDHQDNLQINVTADRPDHTTRDSIALTININSKSGTPIRGIFSLAVTDDSQVRTDSADSNIINNLQLTSDLKGIIEQPGWYLENNSPERLAALDNLLLTQGWVGYSWTDILNVRPKQLSYPAQIEFNITGKLTNVFNKPIKKIAVKLFQKEPFILLDTLTNNNGEFTFKNDLLLPSDSSTYLIQVINKDGERRDFNIGISVDEFVPPVFTRPKLHLLPWYVNSDTLLVNYTGTKIARLKAVENYQGAGRLLKEVSIRAKKVIKDSHNLNGPGEADMIIDEKELKKSTGLTLYDLLQKKFGRRLIKTIRYGNASYMLDNELVAFAIDGLFLEKLRLPVDLYMDMLMASDIKGVEIMSKSAFARTYEETIANIMNRRPAIFPPTFLEITTYSGHGAFLQKSAGRYIYKPVAYGLQKHFYRPRYTVKNSNAALDTDLRSTIHWEPNIITDTTGKATVSFFSADKPAVYTIIIEGTDLNGNIGYTRKKIKIIPEKIL